MLFCICPHYTSVFGQLLCRPNAEVLQLIVALPQIVGSTSMGLTLDQWGNYLIYSKLENVYFWKFDLPQQLD